MVEPTDTVRPTVHPLASFVHAGGSGVLLWGDISRGELHGPGHQ